jgi:hypothetical protein
MRHLTEAVDIHLHQLKSYLLVLSLFLVITSCHEEDAKPHTVSSELQEIVRKEKVTALEACCVACTCQQTIGWGEDYAFLDDNMVRIVKNFYDLKDLRSYTIEDIQGDNGAKERRMILRFEF